MAEVIIKGDMKEGDTITIGLDKEKGELKIEFKSQLSVS